LGAKAHGGHAFFKGAAMAEDSAKKTKEVPVPGKEPEIVPTPEPTQPSWPVKEPEIQPEKEPLTVPPTAPPEIPPQPKANH
jgi:hypothetical protein